MIKLVSSHIISLKIADPIDGVCEKFLYKADISDEILLIIIAYPFGT